MTYANLRNRGLDKRDNGKPGGKVTTGTSSSTIMFPVAALLPVLLASVPAADAWGGPILDLGYAKYEGVYNKTTE